MAKKHKSNRPAGPSRKKEDFEKVPSAPTLFRSKIVSTSSNEQFRRVIAKIKPLLWLRDGKNVRQIESAETPKQAIELLPLATGLGEEAWFDRMRKFGHEALPAISQRLKAVRQVKDASLRDKNQEMLVSELRWRGQAGAQVLMECFEDLDNYGKSLACVVLGLLDAREAVDLIWNYFQKVKSVSKESYLVGALYGLIDLKDERAAEALYRLLEHKRYFFEIFAFLARAGDARAVVPLLVLGEEMPEDEKEDPVMALLGIAHRIGREALVAEIEKANESPEWAAEAQKLADSILGLPPRYPEEYFATVYSGFTPEGVDQALKKL